MSLIFLRQIFLNSIILHPLIDIRSMVVEWVKNLKWDYNDGLQTKLDQEKLALAHETLKYQSTKRPFNNILVIKLQLPYLANRQTFSLVGFMTDSFTVSPNSFVFLEAALAALAAYKLYKDISYKSPTWRKSNVLTDSSLEFWILHRRRNKVTGTLKLIYHWRKDWINQNHTHTHTKIILNTSLSIRQICIAIK